MLKLLISRCARCSKTGAHSDHFLLHINRAHSDDGGPGEDEAGYVRGADFYGEEA